MSSNPLMRDALDTTLCDQVCQLLATGRWFSPGTPVSPTNKTDRHDITEILLKVALSTIKPNHAIIKGNGNMNKNLFEPQQCMNIQVHDTCEPLGRFTN